MTVFRTKRELIRQVVRSTDTVLDIGFAGQALRPDSPDYPHRIIKDAAKETYGVDLELPEEFTSPRYLEASAEDFHFDMQFNRILAFDVIEHLSNPGAFLDRCKEHLAAEGSLVLTTPNAFNFFSLVEKVTHDEPNVNQDHTFYFNKPTIRMLLRKNGWDVSSFGYLSDMLGTLSEGGLKRKILSFAYRALLTFSPKWSTTLIVIAKPREDHP